MPPDPSLQSLCPSSSVFSVDVDPDDDVQSLVLAENRLFSQVLYQVRTLTLTKATDTDT